MTFDEGLDMLFFLGWYPPFVQRSGRPFVGPVSVPATGALVENLLLVGSMRGMGSLGRLAPQVVPSRWITSI